MTDINEIIKKLDDNAKFVADLQKALRSYVTNKELPLEERFRVWEKYCEKEEHPWIIESGILREMIKGEDLNRYQEYDYEYFLDSFDYFSDKHNNKYGSYEDFKEYLIEENFGSFVMDW